MHAHAHTHTHLLLVCSSPQQHSTLKVDTIDLTSVCFLNCAPSGVTGENGGASGDEGGDGVIMGAEGGASGDRGDGGSESSYSLDGPIVGDGGGDSSTRMGECSLLLDESNTTLNYDHINSFRLVNCINVTT